MPRVAASSTPSEAAKTDHRDVAIEEILVDELLHVLGRGVPIDGVRLAHDQRHVVASVAIGAAVVVDLTLKARAADVLGKAAPVVVKSIQSREPGLVAIAPSLPPRKRSK